MLQTQYNMYKHFNYHSRKQNQEISQAFYCEYSIHFCSIALIGPDTWLYKYLVNYMHVLLGGIRLYKDQLEQSGDTVVLPRLYSGLYNSCPAHLGDGRQLSGVCE